MFSCDFFCHLCIFFDKVSTQISCAFFYLITASLIFESWNSIYFRFKSFIKYILWQYFLSTSGSFLSLQYLLKSRRFLISKQGNLWFCYFVIISLMSQDFSQTSRNVIDFLAYGALLEQSSYYTYRYLIVPEELIKNIIFPPPTCLCTFVKNQLSVYVWVSFWTLCSIPLT